MKYDQEERRRQKVTMVVMEMNDTYDDSRLSPEVSLSLYWRPGLASSKLVRPEGLRESRDGGEEVLLRRWSCSRRSAEILPSLQSCSPTERVLCACRS